MLAKPCNRNAEESFPVLSLKSREQKPPNHLLIQDKDVLQPSPQPAEFVVGELIQDHTETGHGHRLLDAPPTVHGGAEICAAATGLHRTVGRDGM